MVVKKRWLIFAIGAVTLAVLAALAGWWLPPLLDFVGANSDLIQGMTDLAQLLLWMGAGAVVVIGWLLGRRAGQAPAQPAPVPSAAEAAGGSIVATEEGVAAGKLAVGGDVRGNSVVAEVYIDKVIADPNLLWQAIALPNPSSDLAEKTTTYLRYLVDQYRYLDFRGMGVTDRAPLRLALTELYVPLKARIELPEGETWARNLRLAGRQMSEEEIAATGQRLSEPLPVIELLQQHDGLIVLGDPGAGKTTFLKYLALHMAQGRQGELGMTQRIPFLLPLSAYANRLAAGNNIPLDDYIYEYYRGLDGALAVGPILDEALKRGGALLLLDGLDEVKEMGRRRMVVEQVSHFFSSRRTPGNKFVLTSRIVGYREVRPVVEGLAECTLVDFEQEEITAFVGKWTAAIEQSARGHTPVAAAQADQERTELLQAVERNPGVRRLASNPLLLTILALMKRQGVTLPERRVELYRNYVDTLLKHWNLARSLGRPPTRDLDVVETLRVLAPLALWMHEVSPGVGLVKQEEMRRKLEALYAGRGVDDPEKAAAHFLADVRDHAGLLVERGAREYGFIHLTFQEYLAAVAIAQQGQLDVEPVVDALAAHVADDNWHEVSLLTISYLGIIQQHDRVASMVVDRLIARAPGDPGAAVLLAGE
ncbi:MAG: NACHT domain-containing protein, partial [Caldilinea sp.]|nr:NACHT domain-containing protein [Caldilinea sp.]